MRKIKIVAILLLSVSFCRAQEKLTQVAMPGSPAAYILGIQPTAVLAPKSFKALETAAYSNFINGDGKTVLPNDFALEFTPFWAVDHGLSLQECLYPDNILDQFYRNFSFSLATAQNYAFEDKTTSNALALGFRTSFFLGVGDQKKVVDFIKKTREGLSIRADINVELPSLLRTETTYKSFVDKLLPKIQTIVEEKYGSISADDLKILGDDLYAAEKDMPAYGNTDTFKTAFSAMVLKKVSKIKQLDKVLGSDVTQNFKDYLLRREGFSMDVAYANFLDFPTNQFDYSIMPRHAVWLSPTYKAKDILDLTAIFRYEWYDTDYYTRFFPTAKTYRNNFDYGFSVAGEFKNFTIQMEAVGRSKTTEIPEGINAAGQKLYTKNKDSDFQCVGTLAYKINKQMVLSYSLGSKFDPLGYTEKTLVSLLSLNFGFGGPSTDNTDTLSGK